MSDSYPKVHRDVAAGMVANALIKEGYFGEDVELFGCICTFGDKKIALYGYDQEAVAMRAYEYLQKGAQTTHIITKNYHLKQMNGDKAPLAADFLKILIGNSQCEPEFIQNENLKFIWSGFAYKDGDEQKVLVNGYFPYVFENYLKLSEKNIPLGEIEFRIFTTTDFEREEVKAQLKASLAKTAL